MSEKKVPKRKNNNKNKTQGFSNINIKLQSSINCAELTEYKKKINIPTHIQTHIYKPQKLN